ncbi:WG repeat-containing protein, partial [Campylobacter coli]|nr:WG repeat-containing protein [Campylobacter coli]
IDKSGKFVIEPKFDYVWSFGEGLAAVELNGKYGFIDKNGEFVIESKFDGVGYFSEGLARVELNGKYG